MQADVQENVHERFFPEFVRFVTISEPRESVIVFYGFLRLLAENHSSCEKKTHAKILRSEKVTIFFVSVRLKKVSKKKFLIFFV